MSVTAIIVARGGSVRLPGKALLPFAGATLIGHKIRTLRRCPDVARVVVGTDSDAIREESEDWGAEVVRANGEYPSANEMCRDMAERVGGGPEDVILWAHPTNPLVKAETYSRAIEAYEDDTFRLSHDSLVSVTETRRHAWVNDRPWNFNPWAVRHPLASELLPVSFQDGAIFIQPRHAMIRSRYFYGRSPLLFPIPAWEGVDIDTREDYDAAVALSMGGGTRTMPDGCSFSQSYSISPLSIVRGQHSG